MSLGQTLKQAREAKGQTISQVADATRMMVQVVEDLEREDFRRVAAPIYGRGFIKLYAEHLELDPVPLIQEFMEIYTGSRPPQVLRRPPSDDGLAAGQSGGEAAGPSDGDADEEPSPLQPPASSLQSSASSPQPSAFSPQPTVSNPQPLPTEEPDLFSVAAARTAAVRSVAEPSRPGDATPPRVRPAADASPKPAAPPPSAPAPSAPRQTPHRSQPAQSWLPAGWTPLRIVVAAGGVLLAVLVLALGVRAVRHHHRHLQAAPPYTQPAAIQHRAQPVPEPYFD